MASTSDITSSEGPVLTLLSKRIRNLRKKLNRITQIEQSNNPIKNKEQQDLLLSKPGLVAVIDELEKLRIPLTAAVDEELKSALDDVARSDSSSKEEKKVENLSDDVAQSDSSKEGNDDVVEDLLKVIYFGSVFNVKMMRGSEFDNMVLTRTHERGCCLTYDTVTDDDVAVFLNEGDLDKLSEMSELLVSRPADSSVSHEDALRRCVEHARKWIQGSEERVDENSDVTYAALREKLAKIVGSYYYKIKPEMKAPADVAAEAAAESYVFVQAETEVEQKEDNATECQRIETYDSQSSQADNHPGGEKEAENSLETPVQIDPVEAQAGGTDNKDQYVPRQTHQNQRGGGRYGGGRGNGRGYGNGRGGRSGGRGGPYQNGRNQYSDQQGNYYPRNQHSGRGRGGRGYGGGYNNHASGGAAEVAHS